MVFLLFGGFPQLPFLKNFSGGNIYESESLLYDWFETTVMNETLFCITPKPYEVLV